MPTGARRRPTTGSRVDPTRGIDRATAARHRAQASNRKPPTARAGMQGLPSWHMLPIPAGSGWACRSPSMPLPEQDSLPPADSRVAAKLEHPNQDALRGMRILLVDDNPFNVEIATTLLERAGVIVTAASGGYEALEMLQRHEFDAV